MSSSKVKPSSPPSLPPAYSKENPYFQHMKKMLLFQKVCEEETCFDDEDVRAIEIELVKVQKAASKWEEEGLQRLRALVDARSEILTKADATLDLQQKHPALFAFLNDKTKDLNQKLSGSPKLSTQ